MTPAFHIKPTQSAVRFVNQCLKQFESPQAALDAFNAERNRADSLISRQSQEWCIRVADHFISCGAE